MGLTYTLFSTCEDLLRSWVPRKGAYHAFYLHGAYNGGVTLVESLKKILRRCFVLRNGQSVINKSPDYVGILSSCSNLSSMLHKHISE